MLIEKNKNWIQYEEKQINAIKETLKTAMIEYEKFKYLQAKEIEKIKKAKKIAEAKRLDEVAMMTFKQKEEK
jgi:flagellar biosynthesis chaperone FliJ